MHMPLMVVLLRATLPSQTQAPGEVRTHTLSLAGTNPTGKDWGHVAVG